MLSVWHRLIGHEDIFLRTVSHLSVWVCAQDDMHMTRLLVCVCRHFQVSVFLLFLLLSPFLSLLVVCCFVLFVLQFDMWQPGSFCTATASSAHDYQKGAPTEEMALCPGISGTSSIHNHGELTALFTSCSVSQRYLLQVMCPPSLSPSCVVPAGRCQQALRLLSSTIFSRISSHK